MIYSIVCLIGIFVNKDSVLYETFSSSSINGSKFEGISGTSEYLRWNIPFSIMFLGS